MRYSLFEEAAVEARICAKEVEEEMEALKARKQVLDALTQHISMALPMLGSKIGAVAPDGGNREAGFVPSTNGEATTEGTAGKDSWTNFMSAIGASGSAPDPTVKAPSASSLSFVNPSGIRERVLG